MMIMFNVERQLQKYLQMNIVSVLPSLFAHYSMRISVAYTLFRNYQLICYHSLQIHGFQFGKHMFRGEPPIMKSLLSKSHFIRRTMQHIAALKKMVLGMLMVILSTQTGLRKIRQDTTSYRFIRITSI